MFLFALKKQLVEKLKKKNYNNKNIAIAFSKQFPFQRNVEMILKKIGYLNYIGSMYKVTTWIVHSMACLLVGPKYKNHVQNQDVVDEYQKFLDSAHSTSRAIDQKKGRQKRYRSRREECAKQEKCC